MNEKPTRATIKRAIRELREIVDESRDPYAVRIAYAVEHALRWASEYTVGWPSPATDVKLEAKLLREEAK